MDITGRVNSAFFAAIVILGFPLNIYALKETSVPTIFNQYRDSVVLIGASGRDGKKTGSGFIVSPDGLIVTSHHLLQGAEQFFVKLSDGTGYSQVEVVNVDAAKDIAVLKIKAQGLKAVPLGNSRGLKVGQEVVAIGNPLGLESTVSDGLISSVRLVKRDFELLQVSVPLSQGSSGGPLFNMKGEVIGVTTMSFLEGQNLNFAVPVNYVKLLLQRKTQERIPLAQGMERTDYISYVIKREDTLFSLAKRFNTTVKKIMAVNRLNDSMIYVGQQIKIPQ